MNPLQHWNGTDQEFWDLVGYQEKLGAGDREILGEILRLAQERAEEIYRERIRNAKQPVGYGSRARRYQEQLDAQHLRSRYIPKAVRDSRCPTCGEPLKYPDQDCGKWPMEHCSVHDVPHKDCGCSMDRWGDHRIE
jgi:hypothetical protein